MGEYQGSVLWIPSTDLKEFYLRSLKDATRMQHVIYYTEELVSANQLIHILVSLAAPSSRHSMQFGKRMKSSYDR